MFAVLNFSRLSCTQPPSFCSALFGYLPCSPSSLPRVRSNTSSLRPFQTSLSHFLSFSVFLFLLYPFLVSTDLNSCVPPHNSFLFGPLSLHKPSLQHSDFFSSSRLLSSSSVLRPRPEPSTWHLGTRRHHSERAPPHRLPRLTSTN